VALLLGFGVKTGRQWQDPMDRLFDYLGASVFGCRVDEKSVS
jgi:hypothetical protein